MTQLDPETMGRNGQLAMEGAAAIGASGGPIPATPATASSAAPAPSAARSTPSAACTSATCRARSPPGRGSAPGSRRGGSWSRTAARSGSAARPGSAADRRRARLHGAGPARGDRRRRRLRHAGAAAALRARRRARSAATSTSTPPAGSAPATRRRCAAGTGVMQSYYVDEWEHAGSCSRRPSRRSPSAAPGCSAPAADHQRAMLDFGHVGSIGVHLSDSSSGRVGLGAEGALRASYKLTREDADRLAFGIARAAEIHFAAGATEVYPNIARVGVLKPGDLPDASRRPPSSPPSCASRPSTRWARRGSPPTRRGRLRHRRLPHGTDGLYVADASPLPDLGRRQPDDDHHRLRQAGRPRDRRAGYARRALAWTAARSSWRSGVRSLAAAGAAAGGGGGGGAGRRWRRRSPAHGGGRPRAAARSWSAVPPKVEPSSCIAL